MQKHYYRYKKIDIGSWSEVHWNQQIAFSILNQDLWSLSLSLFLHLYSKVGLPDHPRKCSLGSPEMDGSVKTGLNLTDQWNTMCKGQKHIPSNTYITSVQAEIRTGNRLPVWVHCFLLASCTFWLWPDLALCLRKISPTHLSTEVQTLTCSYPCANRWALLPATSDETGCILPTTWWTPLSHAK